MQDLLDLSHVRLSERPLVVCDVDDVVLSFAAPFQDFLRAGGYELLPRSFRLTGNIVSIETQLAIEAAAVQALLHGFFEAQDQWQTPLEQVVQTLEAVARHADIVFLTAMPPRFDSHRRRLLDTLGLAFPLIASEAPKGPILKRLHAERSLPTVFIDDMAHNLHSVREHVPKCLLIHMMPDSPLHLLAPKPEGVVRAMDWAEAERMIMAHLTPVD